MVRMRLEKTPVWNRVRFDDFQCHTVGGGMPHNGSRDQKGSRQYRAAPVSPSGAVVRARAEV
jgi:hypothetical protein